MVQPNRPGGFVPGLGVAPGAGMDPKGPQALTAAMFAALTNGCSCNVCRLLRVFASGMADQMMEGVDGNPAAADTQREYLHG